jgi:hypothetical protein
MVFILEQEVEQLIIHPLLQEGIPLMAELVGVVLLLVVANRQLAVVEHLFMVEMAAQAQKMVMQQQGRCQAEVEALMAEIQEVQARAEMEK